MTKVLVFPDGTEIPVVSDGGRYWITDHARYSKANGDITVKRVPDAEVEKQRRDAARKERQAKKEESNRID